MAKDFSHVLEMAEERRVSAPIAAVIAQMYQVVVVRDSGEDDFSSIIRVLWEIAGVA